jgi:hypothetical protein
MKRHLLGFVLFNVIVGTALLVAILTKSFPMPKKLYVYEVSKTSCKTNVRQHDETRKNYENNDLIKVTQAVLDEKTGKLNMSFSVQREAYSTRNIKAKLVFINDLSKDRRNWDEIIGTDYITFSNYLDDNNTVFTATVSYPWLNKLKDNKNLYVYAETETVNPNGSIVTGYSESMPILLMNKK